MITDRCSIYTILTTIFLKVIEIVMIIIIILFYPMEPYAFIAKAIAYYGFPYVIAMLILGRIYDGYFDKKTEIIICLLGFLAFIIAGSLVLYEAKHISNPEDDDKGQFISTGIISIVNGLIFLIDGVLHMFSYLDSPISQANSLIVTKVLELIAIVFIMGLHPLLFTKISITTGTVCGFTMALLFLVAAFLFGVYVHLNSKLIILAFGSVLFLITGCVFLMEARDATKHQIEIIFYAIGGLCILNGLFFLLDSMLTAREIIR